MNALSHTAGYAIVALSFVGHSARAWVDAQEIATQTGIPKPYLSKILHALGKAGVIRTKRGVGGGVALSRPAQQLTLLDVAAAVEHTAAELRCFLGMSLCSADRPCPMHEFWSAIRRKSTQQLAQTTLAQVAEHQSRTGFRAAPLQDLLEGLAAPSRFYRGKPTGRFLRKFAPEKEPQT